MRIALVGTRGVPAQYGGFETAVEEVGRRLVRLGHEVVVYCRRGEPRAKEHAGMHLVHVPAVQRRTAETLSRTALSLGHVVAHRTDVAIVFNAANAPLLPLLRAARIPVATHVDGLEWQRAKWGPTGRRYYRAAERLAVRWSDALIADARGIQGYYASTYAAESVFLPYGAPLAGPVDARLLSSVGLREDGYHLVVARLEPENHVDLMIRGYLRSGAAQPLVVVGSVPYPSEHSELVRRLAASDARVRALGAVWDQSLLDALYGGALTYLHGHSVGGTNPSLLRAMGAGTAVIALDVVFNREVLADTGVFVSSAEDVARELDAAERDPAASRQRGRAGRERAGREYVWDDVARGYERLCRDLLERSARRPRHRAHTTR